MAYVPVPKDLNAVKTKVMLNLTKRQLICFGAGAAIGVPFFFLLKGSIGTSSAVICMIIVMLPFFLLAMYEKNGQPLEKILRNIIQVYFLRPKQRPYDKLIPVTNELNAAEKTPKEAKAVLDSVVADESAEMPAPEIGVEEPLPETAPDNGYMPDPTVSIEAMNAYGYTDADMLPLSKDRAIELAERDVTVYMLYDDNAEAMAFEPEEINNHSGMFGITREDWETVRDQFPTEQSKPDLESAFLSATGDAYVIYQLTDSDENAERRFMGTEYLAKSGISIEHDRYEAIYIGELSADGDTYDKLNGLYRTFNIDHPADFTGHSLSVSDIIALKQAGVISCHYVDSWGFKELPMFLKPENYLKNAEMAMEDDYGMIDGVLNNGQRQQTTAELEEQAKSGKPISLLSYVEAVRRERAENEPNKQPEESSRKPSVLAKLKSPITPANPTKTAPSKSAEREI